MPVSKTEKRGVSSGCRFSDMEGCVPIKKRRFLLRSPSPPSVQTSPCAEETANHMSQDVSNKLVPLQSSSSDINLSQNVDDNNSIGAKKSHKANERFLEDEDFSGTSILAAAACSSSLGRDCGSAEDATGIEESSVLERAREVSTNTESRSSSKARSREDVINSFEISSGATSSCISTEPLVELVSISTTLNSSQKVVTIGKGLNDSCDKDENTVRMQKPSSREDRLHWDLNVVMDEWEQPFDNPSAPYDAAFNISQDVGKSNHTDLQHNLENAYAEQHCLLPWEPRGLGNPNSCEIQDRLDMDAVSNLKQSFCLSENSLPSNSNLNLDVMKCMAEDTKYRRLEETSNPTGKLAVAAAQTTQSTALCTIPESEDASVKSVSLYDDCDGCMSAMGALNLNHGMPSCQLQNFMAIDAVSADTCIGLCVSSNIDSLKEFKQNVAVPELQETPKIHRGVHSLVEDVVIKTVEPLEHPKSAMSDNNGLPETEARNSVSERSLVDGADAADEPHEDYDFQYEDGELRELGGCVLEEYDALDKKAENPGDHNVSECCQVEDRKNESMVMTPAICSHDSTIDNEVHGIVAEAVGNERGLEEGNQIKLSHVVEKKEPVLENELSRSSKNNLDTTATQGADDDDIKSRKPAHIDGYLNSRTTEIRADPKTFRRSLHSQIGAPVAHDEPYREEQLKKMDNRFDRGPIRSFERMRYPFHNQGRGRQGGSWDGSSDGRRRFRRHYSPIMHGNSELDDDGVMERDDLECVGTQDDVSYSQPLFSKNRALRNFSPDRAGGLGRGRPSRYGFFGEGRGGRGRFNRPSFDEICQSSQRYWQPLSRRERSISPFGGRGQSNIYSSRRNSPSQSRSRSPVWNSQWRRLGSGSGGNAFIGNRSRSPNFRSEARMQRRSSPPQQPGYGADHTGCFRSISRNHGSPCNRWSFARKDEHGQVRELGYKQRASALDRSPRRIRLRGDRGSAVDPPRNLKLDGYYRISDRVPVDASRVGYDEDLEEGRKPYNLLRPARSNFDDGIVSRLLPDHIDSFLMPNSFRDSDASTLQDRGLRCIDSRIGDGPRGFRGDNHSFKYERDGRH